MKYIIGIDPDCKKSGVAIYKDKKLELKTLSFFELYDFLIEYKYSVKKVIIEGGHLNKKSNFHVNNKGVGVAARIGSNTGANHETGKKIAEMCEYLKIDYKVIKPLRKVWKKGKISHIEFNKLTGHNFKRTNQEERDASLLVWGM